MNISNSNNKDCLSAEGSPPKNVCIELHSYDLDLETIMLVYKLHPGIMNLHSKNEAPKSRLSKVRARTGETDRQ